MPPKSTPPPDPNTKKPRFTPPPHACDAHCHVFGPAAKFPYAPKAAYWPPDSPVEKMWELHRILGLERAVIVHATCHGADMSATLDAIARSGGRYRGTAIIEESCTDRELERLHEGGIRGVRFNFVKHLESRPDPGFVRRTVERIRPLGWHLIVHLQGEDIIELQELFRPITIPMVIDHMGRPKAADGVEQKPFKALLEFMRVIDVLTPKLGELTQSFEAALYFGTIACARYAAESKDAEQKNTYKNRAMELFDEAKKRFDKSPLAKAAQDEIKAIK